jgi:hypothetical protein
MRARNVDRRRKYSPVHDALRTAIRMMQRSGYRFSAMKRAFTEEAYLLALAENRGNVTRSAQWLRVRTEAVTRHTRKYVERMERALR